jgi:hypothetical protein
LIYYSPSLFETLGLDYELRLTLSGVMNVVQIAGVIPAIFLLDKLGRKFWLYFGSFGMMSSHFIVAAMIGEFSGESQRYGPQPLMTMRCDDLKRDTRLIGPIIPLKLGSESPLYSSISGVSVRRLAALFTIPRPWTLELIGFR